MPPLKRAKDQVPASEGSNQSITLALRIIEVLAFGGKARGVTELAAILGTTKTRVFNYLRTLTELGYASQEAETERYRIGVRVSQLGGAVANEFNLLSLSRGPMRRIQVAFGHTVVLSKFDGLRLYTVEQVEGSTMLKITIAMGNTLGLHSSAQGKVVLAFGPASLLENSIAAGLQKLTDATITDPDRLRKEVALVRKRGWALAPGENRLGVNAIAVPILDRTGSLVATLAMLAVSPFPPRSTAQEVKLLREAAAEIGAGLSDRL